MEKLINTLSEKLKIKNDEVLKLLNIPKTYTFNDINKALGIHAVFTTKEEWDNYLNNKLSKKDEEIRVANENAMRFEKALENVSKENEINKKYAKNILNLVKAEWEAQGIKRPFEKSNIDIEKIDFSNLQKSVLNYATTEGFAIDNNENIQKTKQKHNQNPDMIEVWKIGTINEKL